MSGSTWILVSARMASSRRPGKALADLAGRPLLEWLLERMGTARGVDGLALITSTAEDNDVLDALAGRMGIPVFRGPEDDVLRRHVDAAARFGAEHVVRVTGDNPLTDVETLERLVALHHAQDADYTYVPGDALLMGILPEVVSADALRRSWERGGARHRSELVTLYVKEHPDEFRIATAALPEALYRPQYRLTVDEPDDVRLLQELFARLAVPGRAITTRDAIAVMDGEPELARINAHLRHKPANLRSVALDAGIKA
jgi:spore coat polysaccharide biosynthesis protein SpsF